MLGFPGYLLEIRKQTESVYINARKQGRNNTAEAMRKILSVLSQAIPEYDVETEVMDRAKTQAAKTVAAVVDDATN